MTSPWKRRTFLKRVGCAAAAIGGSTAGALWLRDPKSDQWTHVTTTRQRRDFGRGLPRQQRQLIIAHGDPRQATTNAIAALGGISSFVLPGERVTIKPNVGWDRAPIHAANTNPVVVATVVELCLKAGAKAVVVTDSTCNDARRCFTRSGIWKATEKAGGEVVLPTTFRFRPYDLGGQVLGQMPVLMPALQCDRFINIAVAKHHGLTGFTGAMKNLYGVLGGRRNRLHQDINASIADLADFIRPTLTIMDATRVLLRNGPQGGNVSDTQSLGQVIASTDPVAVDTYACSLIGQRPADLPFIDMAEKRGLGTSDLQRIERREV